MSTNYVQKHFVLIKAGR